MYQRKTVDEYQIHGNYGCGWEEVTAEYTYRDAKTQLKCYDLNEPEYPHRIVKKRIRKVEDK